MRLYFAVLSIFLLISAPALAGAPLPGTGCDSEFWGVMDARAWMEGKSDMEAAQVLITRPQSILDVSCFGGHLTHLANAKLFSNGPPLSAGHLGQTLGSYVGQAMRSHLVNFYPNGVPSPVCGVMNDIWKNAKCINADPANFWTFADLEGMDPRVSFVSCNADRDLWQGARVAAFPPPVFPAKFGGMDSTNTFLNLLDPTNCNQSPAIPTGLGSEAACTAPGCWYDVGNKRCEK